MHFGTEKIYIGCDENGYGTLAGPLVVCAAAATEEQCRTIKCRDSKKYARRVVGCKPEYETKMADHIAQSKWLVHSIVEVTPDQITKWGYANAIGYAYRLAVATVRYHLRPRHPLAIIDGTNDFCVPYSKTYPKADKNWPVVSLASCLGKTRQYARMKELHARYPEYGFLPSCGYGTPVTLRTIRIHGMIPHVHRAKVIAGMNCFNGKVFFNPKYKENHAVLP